MRRSLRMVLPALLTVLAILLGTGQGFCQQKFEPYLEIELKRLEETYNLLDRYGEKIWPGWSNQMDIEYQVQFPNLVFLIVNPRAEIPQGYVLQEGREIRGKKIYLNRTQQLPIDIQPPLQGGGGGGLTITIHLQDRGKGTFKVPVTPEEMESASSESQILLVIHEYFHGFQSKFRVDKNKSVKKSTRPKMTEEELAKWLKQRYRVRPPQFMPSLDYAVYKEIAGRALLNAYNEKNKKKAKEFLKDYYVARTLQLASMAGEYSRSEAITQKHEGTAVYAELRMAMMAQGKKYTPAIGKADDPYFYGYKFIDMYLKQKMESSITHCFDETLDTLGHSYTYGMYECFLLDRFVKKWKKGLFENERTMDDIIGDYLKLGDKEKKAIAERFRTRYDYDKMTAKHGAVIKERDDAIALVENRKGRTYVVDFQATKEFYFQTEARNKRLVRLGVREIYPNGIEKLTLGDVLFTGRDIPMERHWLYTFQYVDTDPKEGEKGYELTFERKDGDVYKNAVVTTKGFTLKAPEIKIGEEENNTVRFEVLSKVAR